MSASRLCGERFVVHGGKVEVRVTDQAPTQTTKPWPREELDLHVTQRIREQVDVALVLYRNDDDGLEPMLREGGEDAVWPRSWRRHVGAAITFEISDADMSRIAQAIGT